MTLLQNKFLPLNQRNFHEFQTEFCMYMYRLFTRALPIRANYMYICTCTYISYTIQCVLPPKIMLNWIELPAFLGVQNKSVITENTIFCYPCIYYIPCALPLVCLTKYINYNSNFPPFHGFSSSRAHLLSAMHINQRCSTFSLDRFYVVMLKETCQV